MTISQNLFNDIFTVAEEVIETHPDALALDPTADLNAKVLVRIPYIHKPKNNAASAFMNIKKSHKNWLGLLLLELGNFVHGAQADVLIMHSSASAKSNTKRSQTWHEFVTELHTDKIIHRNDISERQARHLSKLIELLSVNGFKLNGCGELGFVDEDGIFL